LDTLEEFKEKHRSQGKEYGVILLNNTTYGRILKTYDEQISAGLLKEISGKMLQIGGKTCQAARIKDSVFALIVPTGDWLQIQGLVEEIRIAVGGIRKIQDKPVTLRLKMAYKSIKDESVADDNIYEAALKEVL
jgi:GGDEF domain-containing protein